MTNLGPIAEGSVELRPLSVFLGASNTGKSYLSILLYALHIHFLRMKSHQYPHSWLPIHSENPRQHDSLNSFLDTASIDLLVSWYERNESAFYSSRTNRNPNNLISVPKEIVQLASHALPNHGLGAHNFATELGRCFGVPKEYHKLIRKRSRGGMNIELNRSNSTLAKIQLNLKKLDTDVKIHPRGSSFDGISVRARNLMRPRVRTSHRRIDKNNLAVSLLDEIVNLIVTDHVSYLANDCYFLPASRTGIMHAHRMVVSSLVNNASYGGLEEVEHFPLLSGVLTDFIRELVEIPNVEEFQDNARISKVANQLERELIGGKIQVESSESNYPTFYYRHEDWDDPLPLMRSSSTISELAPVILYLKHYCRPGRTIIIEEPEAHLHPAVQTQFAQYLVKIMKTGVRIIITTHSEWLLEQFANLLNLSLLSKKYRNGLPGEDAFLTPAEFGAWLFKRHPQKSGSFVEEIEFDCSSGTLETESGEVNEQLYNTWAETTNRRIELN